MKLYYKLLLSTIFVFWNVENFFDYHNASTISKNNWNSYRFYAKAKGIGKVILALGDSCGMPPQVVGLAEIDSPFTLKALIYSDILQKHQYRYIHFESPDPRGIDCALLYRDCKVLSSKPIHLTLEEKIVPTRDMLYVEFDSLSVLICHLPSKRGGSELAEKKRKRALQMIDSLAGNAEKRLIVMGDFNEEKSENDKLMNLLEITPNQKIGSIKFQGQWEIIDRALSTDTTGMRLHIADLDILSETDKAYGGTKPRRTYSGPRYLGGLSDHYPIVLEF
ncbi:MAG TPA: hypothetical protein DHU75_04045 [Rikenellaceae bacterium]|mgnify:FL=1|nr:hypothetical protein [Rikenellaceae bacterium]